MSELKITKENYEQLVKSDLPVLIDFWAAWCSPCRMMSPVVAELAEEYAGKAIIGKVNVEEEALKSMGYTNVTNIGGINAYHGKVVR